MYIKAKSGLYGAIGFRVHGVMVMVRWELQTLHDLISNIWDHAGSKISRVVLYS